ncbi:hypothetical protein CC2G_001726 [Coprinopsis cinerea AmutBmut pab1-1]|nr:hypothetical protein CC2G_001726 [Coprinopsis cinerea AmutBmut pab1-1]
MSHHKEALPPELRLRILFFCSKPSLPILARTEQLLKVPAERLLYDALSLDCRLRRSKLLLQTINSCLEKAAMVRRLHIAVANTSPEVLTLLSSALRGMPGLISLDWEWFPYQTSNEEPLTPTTYKGLRQMIINSTTNIRYFMYSYASGIRFAEVLRQNPSIEILGVHNERDSADDDLILDLNPIFQPNENWERVAARPYSLLEQPRPPPLIFYLNKQSTDHHYPDNRCHGLDIKPSLFSEGSKIQLVFIPGVYAHRRERLGMIERVASYLDEHGSFDGTKDWRGDVATVSVLWLQLSPLEEVFPFLDSLRIQFPSISNLEVRFQTPFDLASRSGCLRKVRALNSHSHLPGPQRQCIRVPNIRVDSILSVPLL